MSLIEFLAICIFPLNDLWYQRYLADQAVRKSVETPGDWLKGRLENKCCGCVGSVKVNYLQFDEQPSDAPSSATVKLSLAGSLNLPILEPENPLSHTPLALLPAILALQAELDVADEMKSILLNALGEQLFTHAPDIRVLISRD